MILEMKINCGTDIIEIDRVKKSIERLENKFLNKIFTKKEIEYCESKNKMKFQHYAARFAVKEAVFKAISNNLENKYQIGWKNIEVKNDDKGKPSIEFLDCNIKGLQNIDISISHCKNYATAIVVVIFDE